MEQLFVGIDVSKGTNAVFLMRPNGEKYSSFSVENNIGGAKKICKETVSALEKLKLKTVSIGLESTSVYGESLIYYLKEDGNLGKFQKKIFVFNPKNIKNFKEIYTEIPKNDPMDAFIIADAIRFGRCGKELQMNDYRYRALQTLTRARYHAVSSLAREKQYFSNHLFLKFSELSQSGIFSNNFGATSLAFIEEFSSLDDICNMELEDLINFISEKSCNKISNPEEVAKAIKSAARASYRLPSTVAESVNQVLSISLTSIKAFQIEIKTLDKQIEQILKTIPNTLQSIPGIGPVYAAGIIAEIGDISRFNNQSALAKYAGLAWQEYQSGSYKSENTRAIKTGNHYLKYYLTEAANSLARCDANYKSYYQKKYSEVTKHQHKRALALTARKFLRLVFRLLKDQRLYQA
jgi:transposase